MGVDGSTRNGSPGGGNVMSASSTVILQFADSRGGGGVPAARLLRGERLAGDVLVSARPDPPPVAERPMTLANHKADVHTCHAECPCQTGGEPPSDFAEPERTGS